MARINFVCPDDLLAKIDARAKALSVSRSAYMNMAVARQIETEEMTKSIPQMLEIMDKAIAESKAQRSAKK